MAKIGTIPLCKSRTYGVPIYEKNRVRKSRFTVPLTFFSAAIFAKAFMYIKAFLSLGEHFEGNNFKI